MEGKWIGPNTPDMQETAVLFTIKNEDFFKYFILSFWDVHSARDNMHSKNWRKRVT